MCRDAQPAGAAARRRARLAAAVALGLMSICAAGCSGPGSRAIPSPPASPTPTPTPTPEGPSAHTYVVKQTQTLGRESISGAVCNLAKPFTVTSVTPAVTFNFAFVPTGPLIGGWNYAYSIASAGETHDAVGTYKVSEAASGVLTVVLTGSDHVVFHGFDGPFPIRYQFDLVPTGAASC